MLLLTNLLLSLFFALAFAQDILINLDGKKLSSISLDEIKQMQSTHIEHFSSTIMRAKAYKGVSTTRLLEKFYTNPTKLSEIEFVTDNGINPLMPMSQILKHDSILAYERADGQKFVRFSKKEKILVPLGPLYLVWKLDRNSTKEEKLTLKSLYQIKAINLYSNPVTFGISTTNTDPVLQSGLQFYKAHCISCHAIGPIGGSYSFSLNERKPLKDKGAEYVKKYVIDPVKMNPKTKMIQMPLFEKDEKSLQSLIEFMSYMEDPAQYLKNKSGETAKDYKNLRNVVDEMKKGN